MRRWKTSLIALCLVASLVGTATASHSHTGSKRAPITSPWAQEEVTKALELGFVPQNSLPEDYRSPITRQDFRQVAMHFAALQTHSDAISLEGMVSLYLGKKDADGSLINVFTDGTQADAVAYYLGLVQGYGDGTFRPEGLITRQEAAAMLTRAYGIYGGTLPIERIKMDFPDGAQIEDWAKDSAATLAFWKVMVGMEDGSFAPRGHYTIEQCIVTFLRLYENTPVSRKQGNTVPLFTPAQGFEYLRSGAFITEDFQLEGAKATFVRTSLTGVMRKTSKFHLVYPDGGVLRVDLGICDTSYGVRPSLTLENLRFSQDGTALHCTVILSEDVISYMDSPEGTLLHQKGVYEIAIDVNSGRSQLSREDA